MGESMDVNEMPSLRELLLKSNEKHQLSGRRLAALAEKQGFRITHATVNSIMAGTYKSTPSAETVRAIAYLAGVRDEIAFTAAGQPVPGPPFADELPPGVDHLTPKARRVVIELLRVLVEDQTKGSDGNVSTAPITRAGESPAAEHELTQDQLDWAAYDTGRESQGRRLRRLQDEAAEAGQDYEGVTDP